MQKDEILRVVETEAILFLKSMSETVESDISTILKWFISDTIAKNQKSSNFRKFSKFCFWVSLDILKYSNEIFPKFQLFGFLGIKS